MQSTYSRSQFLQHSPATGCLRSLQSPACATVCQSGPATIASCRPKHSTSETSPTWFGRRGGHSVMKPTARWALACEGRGLNHKPHVHTRIFFCLFRHPGMKSTPLAGWVTGPGMSLAAKRHWKPVRWKWIRRWRLCHWWNPWDNLFLSWPNGTFGKLTVIIFARFFWQRSCRECLKRRCKRRR